MDCAEYCRPVAFIIVDRFEGTGNVVYARAETDALERDDDSHDEEPRIFRAPALDRGDTMRGWLRSGCWVECLGCGHRIGDDDYVCEDCEAEEARQLDEIDESTVECDHGRHPVYDRRDNAYCSQECMDAVAAKRAKG